MIRFAFEVEERNVLGTAHDGVGHHALAVDPEEAAPVARIAFLENKLLVTKIEDPVKLFGVVQSDDEVFAVECVFAVVVVDVLQVDFVEQLALGVGDEVGLDAVTAVHLLRQDNQKFVQQCNSF